MIYIETAKREVEKEMIFMGAKIRKIDELRSTLEETTKMIKDKNQEQMLETEQLLLK